MGKAILLIIVAVAVAVYLVPFQGKTLWQRAERRGVVQAASRLATGAFGWVAEAVHSPPARGTAVAAARGRRPPEPTADRILKAPPKERLSRDDRAALDRLVDARTR